MNGHSGNGQTGNGEEAELRSDLRKNDALQNGHHHEGREKGDVEKETERQASGERGGGGGGGGDREGGGGGNARPVRELTNENYDYVKNQIKNVSLSKLEETKVRKCFLNCLS